MTRLAALLLMLLMPAVACAQLMAWAGPQGLTSATINSDGDTLTVVAETTVTLSSAAGFSLEFSNQASRTLAYTSGSGTDTLVFSINAVSPSTDDRAPVGTTVTLDYDADTGNASGLEETTDFAVTNNSTQIPDPDLPQNLPATTLPTGWNGTADHTPDNITELNELTDGDGSGDVAAGDIVEIATGGTYAGLWTIDDSIKGTANAPIIFRTSGHAGLPAAGTRIASDEDSLATVTSTGTATDSMTLSIQKGTGGHGASYLRFIGLKFEMTGSYTDVVNIITIGGVSDTRDSSEVPVGIGFNHCWVTASDTTQCRVAVRFDATDSFFVDGRFTNLDSGGEDGTTGIRFYVGERLVFDNLYMQVESAGVFLGDNVTTRCDDVKVSNCHMTRPAGWDDGDKLQKSPGLEVKTGLRVLIEKNYVENGTWCPDAFGAFTIKAGEPSVDVIDKWTRHVTIRNNEVANCKLGFSLNEKGSGSLNDQEGPNMDMLLENNVVWGTTTSFSGFINGQGADDGTFDRITIRHNSFDKVVFCSGTEDMRYLSYYNNIQTYFQANTYGFGVAALNPIWDTTYDVQYNIFVGADISGYDNHATPLGTIDNNLFPADFSTVGYSTYPPTTLAQHEITGGVGNNAGSDSTDIGANVSGLVTILSGVKE